MLKYAKDYKEQYEKFIREMSLDIKNKYYFVDNYVSWGLSSNKSNWDSLQLVDLDKNNNVIGYVNFTINRPYARASMAFISNGSQGMQFLKTVKEAIDKVFILYGSPKISWSVLIGNPAEKLYDRFIESNGGNVVGILKKHFIAMDGEICDSKSYEILREDYMAANNLGGK